MCLLSLSGGCTDEERAAAGRPSLQEVVESTYRRNHLETPAGASQDTLATDGLLCEPVAW